MYLYFVWPFTHYVTINIYYTRYNRLRAIFAQCATLRKIKLLCVKVFSVVLFLFSPNRLLREKTVHKYVIFLI